MKRRIISSIIALLLIINLFPSLFINTAYGSVSTTNYGNLLKTDGFYNVKWGVPVNYDNGDNVEVILNKEWIYGDGTVGYKRAENVYAIPDNATWAYPRFMKDRYSEYETQVTNTTTVVSYVRKNGRTTRQVSQMKDLQGETIFVYPYRYQNQTSTYYSYGENIVAYDSLGNSYFFRDTLYYNSKEVENFVGFINSFERKSTSNSSTSLKPPKRDGNIIFQYNDTPFLKVFFKKHHLIDINGNSTISPIGGRDAYAKGEVSHRGRANVTQHGHVWGTSPNPTVDLPSKTQLGARNSGIFTSHVTGLTPGTTYYIRPYATNAYGTAYGPEQKFTTLPFGTKGYQYNYIGETQNFTVPTGVNEVTLTLKGPSATPNNYYAGIEERHQVIIGSGPPAFGGIMKAKMNTLPGQVLNINVGGMHGWNGGGRSIHANLSDVTEEELAIENIPYTYGSWRRRTLTNISYGAWFPNDEENSAIVYSPIDGAGATDIRINGNSLENRIVVVGGGGAGENYTYHAGGGSSVYGRGGHGAGIPGNGGDAPDVDTGNARATGGKAGTLQNGGKTSMGIDGTLGQGGHSIGNASRRFASYGGGAGYYGGGGGETRLPSGNFGDAYAGGAGGSAFLSSMLQFISGQNGAHYGHGQVIIEIPNNPPTINNLQPNNTIHKGGSLNITWADSDPDGDPLERNIKIETTDGQIIYNGKPSGEKNHSFDTNLVSLNWNTSNNRYERGLKVTVTVDDLYGGVAERTAQFTLYNYRPSFEISTQQGTHNINDSFTLSGKAWDSNRDNITISAVLNGVAKTTTVNNSPSSKPTNDNWTLTWTDLKEGSYSNIAITVTDDKGSSQTFTWNGTVIVKDVLKIIDKAIQENILPNTDNKTRVIIGNTNVQINENTTNNQTINSIRNNLNNRDAEIFFVGQGGSTKNYIENRLTNHYGIYGESYVDSLIELILSMNNQKNSNIFIVGDFIDMEMLFIDSEKDYEGISIENKLKTNEELQQLEETLETIIMKAKAGTLQAKYAHDPNVFDNPVIIHSKSNDEWRIIQDIEDDFIINRAESNMRGEWTLTMKGSDDTGVPLFDKYSNEETITFVIHEKPKALISYWEDTNNFYLSGENSYDTDYQYREEFPDGTVNNNQGIIRYQWHYQLENGNWYNYPQEGKRITMPKIIAGNPIKGYGLTVTDFHGASDTTRETNLIDPELRAKLHSELTKFNLNTPGIPASEEIKVIDIETIPFATDRIEFALYQGGIRRTPLRTLNNPADLLISDVTYHQWRDIRNYQIPETLADGVYTARITAPKADLGLNLTKEWSVRVKTPINLEPTMPSLVQAGETYEITATTSKYTNAVTVDIFSDGNIRNMQLINQVNDIKYWRLSFTAPFIEPKVYTARFRATTPNGNEEMKTRNFTLQILDLNNLRITNMVNHVEYEGQYPILYNDPKVPVNYKAGYYVTFKIDAVGSPDNVRMRITYPGYNQEFDMVKESENGLDSVWRLEWYSDPFVPKGTLINTNVSARKNATTINFNDKYSWDGNYLRVSGSIEGDWRIDQEL